MADYVKTLADDGAFGTNSADTFALSFTGAADATINGRNGADVADFGNVVIGAGSFSIAKVGDDFVVSNGTDDFTLENFESFKFANGTLSSTATVDASQLIFAGTTTGVVGGAPFGGPTILEWNGTALAPVAGASWAISAVNGAAPTAGVVVVPGVGVATLTGPAGITFASTAVGVKIGGNVALTITYTDSVSGKSFTQTFDVSLSNTTGSDGNDTFDGTAGIDTVDAGKGNDWLSGLDGNDALKGGDGNDTIWGGLGLDVLEGGAGNDVVGGGDDNDTIVGDGLGVDGSDTLYGGAGADKIFGGSNDAGAGTTGLLADKIWAGEGDDIVYGASGDDVIGGGAGVDELHGGAGNDVMYGADGDDDIFGDAGNDTIYGGAGLDSIVGGAGNDEVHGAADNDTILGGAGNDKLYGEDGNDSIQGGTGDDLIEGGAGDDKLYGEDGNDTINGGDGNDLIVGGEGADVINGGAGTDTIDLSVNVDAANDTVVFGAGFGQDTVLGFVSGEDKLDVSAFGVTSVTITYEALGGDNYAVIDLGNGNEILVEGFDGTVGNTLSQSDFVF